MENESEIERSIINPPPFIDENSIKKDDNTSFDTLSISWCYGFNKNLGALNLCTNNSRKLFLASSHIGILYDFDRNEQKQLQGHKNSISCITVSEDKRWLVTADAGTDSTIIVWDINTCLPVQTYFNPHADGIIASEITKDSKFIATLSAKPPQVMAIWEWTTDSEMPLLTVELQYDFGLQRYIKFNSEDSSQIMTNGDTQAIFFQWNVKDGIKYFAPTINEDTFNKQVGKLTQSIFQTHKKRAVTATSIGNIVVWQPNENATYDCDKKAVKLFKFQEKSINTLTSIDDLIVIGDSDGQIKFLDQNLHVVMWYKHFKLGPVASLSFSQNKDSRSNDDDKANQYDASINQNVFNCRNFIISTTSSSIAHISKSCTHIEVIIRGSDAGVYGLDCHPSLPQLCFGNSNGSLQLWDYEKQLQICSRFFSKAHQISCLKYDHCGDFIAVGFKNGNLQIIDSLVLNDVLEAPFSYAREAITHISFSNNSAYMATAEADFSVSIYTKNSLKSSANEVYTILGRYRSHYKPIVGLLFGIAPDTNDIRLLSLGEDRVLVEYDLVKSDYDNIVLKNSVRIEQYAIPLSMTWYPPINKESFLLTFNNQWKYKLYNSTTKMCRKTLLGPTFGSLIKKLVVIPKQNDPTQNRYLAYVTQNKLGLQKLPLTGNPFDSVAILSHPDGVTELVSSHDGKYLFTSGGENCNVFMWKINFDHLNAQAALGGTELTPFYNILEGGRDGPLFKEMKELFYYSQLRHQGLHTNNERKIKLTIPLSEIPFIMRGLGFYPTEQEVEDMIAEVKFSVFVEKNEYTHTIDLNEFIKLYLNHRPAFGLDPYEIYHAFKTLKANNRNSISRNVFLNELQEKGEHLTEYELADCLSNLLHLEFAIDDFNPDETIKLFHKHLPDYVDAEEFMNHLMDIPKDQANEILKFCSMNDVKNIK